MGQRQLRRTRRVTDRLDKEPKPYDIDIVTFYHRPDQPPPELDDLFRPSVTRERYNIDAYSVVLGTEATTYFVESVAYPKRSSTKFKSCSGRPAKAPTTTCPMRQRQYTREPSTKKPNSSASHVGATPNSRSSTKETPFGPTWTQTSKAPQDSKATQRDQRRRQDNRSHGHRYRDQLDDATITTGYH